MIGIFVWSPWASETRQLELGWLEAYSAWLERAPDRAFGPTSCERSFDAEVGPPPSRRLQSIAEIAQKGCASYPDPADWRAVGWRASSNLIEWRSARAETTEEPRLAQVARRIAQTPVRTYCWIEDDWHELAEEWALLDRDEYWVAGFADPFAGEIHLSPEICDPLRRFFMSAYAPFLNEESLDLSIALTVLAHEAGHIRDPDANEAVVECHAIQRVRGLVLDEGRSPGYANELAGLAADITYPRMPPEYRTRRCHPGGPLDLSPETPAWP
ncbi:MAG: hypothetical protein WD689_07210 [Gaiellaceae bacterium]